MIGGSTIIINIVLSFVFYQTTGLGVAGMALAYSLASVLNAFLLLTILNKKMKGIYLFDLLKFLLKVVPASLIMGGVLFLIDAFIDMDTGSKIMQVVSLTLEIAAGVLIYFTAVLLMRVEEAINIKNKFISKFSGLIRRKA